MAGAIAQHRRNCESLFVLMKNPILLSGGSAGKALYCAARSNSERAAPSACRRQAVLITYMEIESTSWGTRRCAGGRPTVGDEPRKLVAIHLDAKVLRWLRKGDKKKAALLMAGQRDIGQRDEKGKLRFSDANKNEFLCPTPWAGENE